MARRREQARGESEATVAATLFAAVMLAMWRLSGAVSTEFGRVLLSLAGSR
ncbi:MAG: hypothetical protein M3069_32350 [Chloroflexota bacterium]|nr:hypothetical protein [Chloroflexota bacterium]